MGLLKSGGWGGGGGGSLLWERYPRLKFEWEALFYGMCLICNLGGRINVMFKKRAEVFYRVQNHEAQPSGFKPDKTHAASCLNGFKSVCQ